MTFDKTKEQGIFDSGDKEIAKAIREASYVVAAGLNAVASALQALAPPPAADTIILTYTIGGNIMGAPVTMNVGNTATPAVVETAAGVPVAPIGPLVFASDNTAAVTVDPSTGVATGVAAGSANVSVIDQGNNLTDTVAFTISSVAPPPADTLTLSYTINPSRRR